MPNINPIEFSMKLVWPTTIVKQTHRHRHWLAGLALGLGIGLPAVFFLDTPWLLGGSAVLLSTLAWFGRNAEPALAQPLARQPVEHPRRTVVKDGPFEMMDLPGGSFLMGSPESDDMADDDEKPQHKVQVSCFRMARTPVTVALYAEIMGRRASEKDGELPVADVPWYDAIHFSNRLSRRQGYRPCYKRRPGLGDWRKPWTWHFGWHCDWRADGYRLPTEAEWEFACRAGRSSRYSFGDDPALLDPFAWYGKNSENRTHPVGTKAANPWGLFDMHGNVWEWCWNWDWDWDLDWDWRGANAAKQSSDPHGPKGGDWRVLRGGSFFNPPMDLRSAIRIDVRPEVRAVDVGFRCVRVAPPSIESLSP